MRASQIQTFGWPIAVLLENRPEYRPCPFGDGIRAELAFADDRRQYVRLFDHGQGRRFYLLQSLLRRYARRERALFRHTHRPGNEALMFPGNLYAAPGAALTPVGSTSSTADLRAHSEEHDPK